ncbi:BRO-N domain-containing protein [Nostoc sp. 'Peltigera membranacea cyanobiont' N6]|uniref:BRO-N domain-containing protein n=1 Tax=Nostoc sp. 'Peltigera membranacea cyanobiont' N6 TaxID=1261031 RepID=UPI000D0C47BD|nr:BRO family protein [Nostoc sp. 'Peltigera membranacea cyanobiont' N6]AVH68180.1 prophage antirepressor [Nostoc sp. 'Peltigera membranacea cyanobiont' N6]
MSNLSVFAFEEKEVRFVGTAEKPQWVASDVCNCLEIRVSGVSEAIASLEDDEKGNANVVTLGGEQEMLTVTEPGLYRLIFKSRKPVAKRFQRWVFHEVLPAIRKTGSYSLHPSQPPTLALPPVEQRLKTLVEAMKTLAEITGGRLNPYMEQQINDYAANLLADHNRQSLIGTEEKWLGVVNFAESELGKKVPLKGSHYRGHLGTWVRTFYPQLGDRQETRLVNGVQQPIYVYACHDPVVAAGLTKAIEEFFAHPSPGAALRQAGAFASKKAVVTA